MSKFFNGMLPFEIVLLIMGVIIFLALIFLLIWNDLKKEKIVALLPFFLIPVILVGYPSVQSVEFKDDGLSIQKYTQDVKADPTDTASIHALTDKLEAFRSNPSRVMNNPEALATIAGAQLALGNLDSAALTIGQASRIAPQSGDVKRTAAEINQHLVVRQQFNSGVSSLEQDLLKLQSHPGDTLATGNITRVLSTMQQPAYIDAPSALVLAKALAVMNQPAQSVQVINQVLSTNASSVEARQLKASIQAGKLSTDLQATPTQQKAFQKSAISLQKPFNVIPKDR